MKYRVSCRNDWDAALKEQFGEVYDTHELTGDDVVAAIIKHGRAEIRLEEGFDPCYVLEFQNDYD
jgi:hypothetical protein